MPDKKPPANRPMWIWLVSRKVIPLSVKHFYSYFCWFGSRANYEWNCRLAIRFHVSRSTIKSWLRLCKKLRLLWITSGGGRHRRIHARHYKSQSDWIFNLAIPQTTHKWISDSKNRSIRARDERRRQLIKQFRAISSWDVPPPAAGESEK